MYNFLWIADRLAAGGTMCCRRPVAAWCPGNRRASLRLRPRFDRATKRRNCDERAAFQGCQCMDPHLPALREVAMTCSSLCWRLWSR